MEIVDESPTFLLPWYIFQYDDVKNQDVKKIHWTMYKTVNKIDVNLYTYNVD